MYTHEDMAEVERLLKKRWRAAAIPAALVLAAGIALFVVGRMNRSDTMWMATAALTVLGGGYFLFLYGVWVKPARVYRRHVDYMLNGRMRETTGVLKSFSEDVSDREGLECHAMMLNVGEKDDPEDDRLFYFDALKPWPGWAAGTRLTVKSNDKMVASITEG
ncbi:MAG: hypothetical protein MR842_10410 [Clostridiales bacterium]|nr:hypothetical protein [Clostridiales bacterium]MDO4350259.1 hypothetical protein [Eubacteriales bacterium]MDY4009113.1 hypothetical protein [Candidatus Limiplasma sp.]